VIGNLYFLVVFFIFANPLHFYKHVGLIFKGRDIQKIRKLHFSRFYSMIQPTVVCKRKTSNDDLAQRPHKLLKASVDATLKLSSNTVSDVHHMDVEPLTPSCVGDSNPFEHIPSTIFYEILKQNPVVSTWRELLAIPTFARLVMTDKVARNWRCEFFLVHAYDDPHQTHEHPARETWRLNGLLHREDDLPAIIDHHGYTVWYRFGKKHRDNDKPAKEFLTEGSVHRIMEWWVNDQLHRENDLPAIIREILDDKANYALKHRFECWFKNGVRHRDGNKPAVVDSDGDVSYYKNGFLFREGDLPARIERGAISYYKDGVLHRDDGKPAIITKDGSKHYYREGKRHRDNDLPAIEKTNGDKHWFVNGLVHRASGDLPAISLQSGSKSWMRMGEYYRESGNYTHVTTFGAKIWFVGGKKIHRDSDLPAVIMKDGTQKWYRHGKKHRVGDKPAVLSDEKLMYYCNDKLHRKGDKPAYMKKKGPVLILRWYHKGVEYHPDDGIKLEWQTLALDLF
jgi:hypothetical protein